MPVVSSKTLKGGERAVLCSILAEMAAPELTIQTKHRLSDELSHYLKGYKSFDDFGNAYSLNVKQRIDNGELWVRIYIPYTFTEGKQIDPANRDTVGAFVDFLIQTTHTKPGEKMDGIPVLSKEEADNIYKDVLEKAQHEAEKLHPELKN